MNLQGRKETKQQVQQSYNKLNSLNTVYIQSKIQAKDSNRLPMPKADLTSLQTLPQDYKELQKTPEIMANCNPVIPVMDWTEDAKLHKKYVEWKEEVELELGLTLLGKSNSVKSNYVLRWAGKPARDYLKNLPESEFKYEGANAEAILEALEKKTKPKSNEIAAFTKLHSLKQGDMPLSEFIREARDGQSYATTQMTRIG